MDRLLNNNRIHHHQLFDLNTPATAGDGSTTTSAAGDTNSSSGSTTSSLTRILRHPVQHFTSSSTHLSSTQTLPPQNDSLARILMDHSVPSIPLPPHYQPWAIHLPHLTLGPAFAQGAFGRLYRGSYRGGDVAIKLLEKPENDPERGQLMEQQFGQEVMMLANLKHVNIVRFVGACRKEGVWCIVTEYAKGGSVRQNLARRQSGWIPVRVAVRQALDVARGMEYVHGMGFIHRDLKSDNLLICGDKSIKIADFGVARIEVQTEGMTPETGTYRWMAP